MEIILELIIRRIIISFLGVNVRYFFFLCIGNSKSFQELRGENEKGEIIYLSQQVFNIITGLVVSSILILGIVYIVF